MGIYKIGQIEMSVERPKLLLVSPWDSNPISMPNFDYVTDSGISKIKGIVCIWQPNEQLLESSLPRAWYFSEPINSNIYQNPLWQNCLNKLKPKQLLFHGHENPEFRVPHITHVKALEMIKTSENERQSKAIAIVSNRGDKAPRKRSEQIKLRNALCINSQTDLYGKKETWQAFRHNTFELPKLPSNYQGSIPGRWSEDPKTLQTSQYKAAICLENTLEPHYFTEKFVDAVRAGCIPIYKPHPTVKASVLNGARWVDPSDFDSASDCINYALSQDLDLYQAQNEKWLKSPQVRQTERLAVFERLGQLLLSHQVAND